MHPIKSRSFARRIGDRLHQSLDLRLVRWMGLGDTQQAWYLKKLFALLEIDLVIDVGGNLGQYASLLRDRVGYRGPLITVEPIPQMAAALQQRFGRDKQWDLMGCALGEKPGRSVLNVMQGHELSSLLEPSDVHTDRLDQLNRVRERLEIDVKTVDQLMSQHPLAKHARNVYLKLDVQGFELPVLRGAICSLPRIVALQAEASVIPLYTGMPMYHDLMRDIEALGYQLSFVPAHNYTQVPDMIDFDCHFVSRAAMISRGYLRNGAATSPVSGQANQATESERT
jgi:FkbM family methyltransferase